MHLVIVLPFFLPLELEPMERKPLELWPLELWPLELKPLELWPLELKPLELEPMELESGFPHVGLLIGRFGTKGSANLIMATLGNL